MTPTTDPKTCADASRHPEWQATIEVEKQSLIKNKTWELRECPPGVTPVTAKWIFKTKLDSVGLLAKSKARLVARGFMQQEGIDYNEVFAPVAKWNTMRVHLNAR